MANYLDANPGEAACIRCWGAQMVPIARDGFLLYLMHHRNANKAPIDTPLPVVDYVVGLELLGYRFELVRYACGKESLFLKEADLSEAWCVHSLRIMQAFGTGRRAEIVDFIRERDGVR